MYFKTIHATDAARVAALPMDYEWDTTIGNGFIAAMEERAPRLSEAIEALNIRGAADLALGAMEWCLARTQAHVDPEDGRMRIEAAWAATVDARFAALQDVPDLSDAAANTWSLPEHMVRCDLFSLCNYIGAGRTAKVRQTAFAALLLAEHLCGRDHAFGPWLKGMLDIKRRSSPRRPDDADYTYRDHLPPQRGELTTPSREERLTGLDPATNPYLRSAADMAALGFIGNPYPDAS